MNIYIVFFGRSLKAFVIQKVTGRIIVPTDLKVGFSEREDEFFVVFFSETAFIQMFKLFSTNFQVIVLLLFTF